jgi:hypothetical protein
MQRRGRSSGPVPARIAGRASSRPTRPAVAQVGGAGNRAIAQLVGPSNAPVQRDVVSDVESKMSYGVLDWAVTDSEAASALYSLAALPGPARNAAMGRLSSTAKRRLFENLPSPELGTPQYTKVVVSLGAREAISRYSSLAIDEAIVTDNPTRVFDLFVALDAPRQAVLAKTFTPRARQSLADALVRSATMGEPERTAARSLFDLTPDVEVATLKKIMQYRFRIPFGTQTAGTEVAQEWDGPSLRRMYNVLQSLPDGAVENNPNLARIDRYQVPAGSLAGGYYAGGTSRVAVGFGTITALDNVAGAGGMTVDLADPLVGQNVFDGTVRHEVGHAVDRRLGLSATYCIGNAAGGNWASHGNGAGLAAILVANSGGEINKLSAARKTAITNALQNTITTRTPAALVSDLRKLAVWRSMSTARKRKVLQDPAVRALQVSFANMTPGNPWYRATNDGGIELGGRIYEESYRSQWWSYAKAARARKVSSYQFRAPGEWIAEAYSAYYAPPTKGAKLAAVDAATKAWFDVNVDQATGGQGAAGAGPALPAAASGPGFS